jgi:hypothetical protein
MLGPVVVDIEATRLSDADRARLAHPRVGMVILFARNFESAEQLRALTADIHALRSPPLLIAVDHEGGRVQRFRQPPFTRIPPMARLGALWDRDPLQACRAATAAGYVIATELRAHGVDLTFAPVLDLEWGRSSVIGDRALHGDPRVVALLAAQLTHGLAMAGMANCAKHFPGHGWPEADSHVAVPVDDAGGRAAAGRHPGRRCGAVSLARRGARRRDAGARRLPAGRRPAGGLFFTLDQGRAAPAARLHRRRVHRRPVDGRRKRRRRHRRPRAGGA